MHNTKLISSIIILICLILSFNIMFAAYSEYQNLRDTQARLEHYKSAPRNLLEPEVSNINLQSGGATNLGKLIIPRLDLEVWIRTDTVNAYDSVYHYPESVMPGMDGHCGLLGHRTSYSGPFRNIGNLRVGDEVIIQDMVVSREYVYQVVSNGADVRWDYKTNPIQFAQDGDARLMLITCYPPGRKDAAWITHCRLVSTSNI